MELILERLLATLPIMGKGMLGIFVVTSVIILLVSLLNRFTTEKPKPPEE